MTPLKGSYTFTLNSLGLVEENATTLPSMLITPILVSKARHQLGRSSIENSLRILYKHFSKQYSEVIKITAVMGL